MGFIRTTDSAKMPGAYPTVRWLDSAVTAIRAAPSGFAVSAAGEEHSAKRLILATGVVDELPAIPGLRERWGKTVFHCPYCDGHELGRGNLGLLAAGPLAHHYATIVSEWISPGGTTLFLNDGVAPPTGEREDLASRGIQVESGVVHEAKDGAAGVELVMRDGRRYDLAALFALPQTHLAGEFARLE